MKTPGIKTVYKERAIPGMKKELGIKSPMALPRVSKVVVNVGIGQKVVMTKAKKAIAGFKIREGLEVGARVTLHGERMWDFLDRFFNVALPRVRDFQGLSKNLSNREQSRYGKDINPRASTQDTEVFYPYSTAVLEVRSEARIFAPFRYL